MKQKTFLKSNFFLRNRFNLGEYDYTTMLDFGNNAWGIKWYYSVFIRNGLNVFPPQTLVKNTGFDGSGTNGGNTSLAADSFAGEKTKVSLKESVDLQFFDAFIGHFKKENISLLGRFKALLKRTKHQTN